MKNNLPSHLRTALATEVRAWRKLTTAGTRLMYRCRQKGRTVKHLVQMSGGTASYVAAKLASEEMIARGESPQEKLILLFADVRWEDPDLYRFLCAGAANIGVPITVISDGRNPLQLMEDENFIASSRRDLCSRKLKRELLDAYCKEHLDPETTIRYIGLDWTEINRFDAFAKLMEPWTVRAPLIERGLSKEDAKQRTLAEGLELPQLYKEGFHNNNCGGRCVKQGQGGWANLYFKRRPAFDQMRDFEQKMMARVGQQYTFLRDRRGKTNRPMSLLQFEERIKSGDYDSSDLGGCGCALPLFR